MRRPVAAQTDTQIGVPDFCLVVLIGATGSGKSTFAKTHFKASEIISSDAARALVGDDENDQSVSADAFDIVAFLAEKRLKNRKLAVIDATNVRPQDRARWVEIARRYHALPVAIVLDPGLTTCIERNKLRADRNFGASVPQRMIGEIRKGLNGLSREGFRQIWKLGSADDIDAASVKRQPMWTDRRDDSGPFDIIGDVHGCADELETLLVELGYALTWHVDEEGERCASLAHPLGRKAVFVGDLTDRGPKSPDVVRIAMATTQMGGYVVQGNHDHKLDRWFGGRDVKQTHGLAETIEQLGHESDVFKARAKHYLADLRSHYWLDNGRVAVAHAGLKAEMIGRGSPAVRAFALYGETTGEIDEFGLPVRANWAAAYKGDCAVVYGHTPTLNAEWLNNTICIDTGCVFGGKLTALRWPERDLVSVPAKQTYYEPIRPLAPETPPEPIDDGLIDYEDVSGRRWIDTTLMKRVVVAEENAAAALEVVTRFALNPAWLAYLPPTMSPVETSPREGWLERPEEAFAFFKGRGQTHVVIEEKHMGSRAVIALTRNQSVREKRFGIFEGSAHGSIWTRTGRAFFSDAKLGDYVLSQLAAAAEKAGLWDELKSDWLMLDAEIMPWSAKAQSLIDEQYAPTAAAAKSALAAAHTAATAASARGIDLGGLVEKLKDRCDQAELYAKSWAPYVWPVISPDDIKVAPFHILASEGQVHFDKDHVWHMGLADRLTGQGLPCLRATKWRVVSLSDDHAVADATAWWETLTAGRGEGMVVKPLDFIAKGQKGLIQPAIKVRGKEYLRIIYGPEYDAPENLVRLKERGLGGKRSLALKEFALGHEALIRFVARAPLRKVFECAFGVLALESEPIDPRL